MTVSRSINLCLVTPLTLIIRGIIEKIKDRKNEKTMILITSDHWLSMHLMIQNPPFLLQKILNDETKIINEKKVMNIFIPDLILNFLENKIKSHLEINNYVNNLNDIDLSLIKNNLQN